MVVHYIENHLDIVTVQRLDHISKLVHRSERFLARAVRLMGAKVRDGRVAPVVHLARRAVLGVYWNTGSSSIAVMPAS